MTPVGPPSSAGDERATPGTGDAGGQPARQFSRRSVIGALAAGGLTAGLVGSLVTACSDSSESTASPASQPTTEAGTEAEQAIVRIGQRYRADHPEDDDREVLLDQLGVGAADARSSSFLSSLDDQVADDYRAGRTVQLDGWVLSVTEGRAAALVSLA
jgi:hypothetical protein